MSPAALISRDEIAEDFIALHGQDDREYRRLYEDELAEQLIRDGSMFAWQAEMHAVLQEAGLL